MRLKPTFIFAICFVFLSSVTRAEEYKDIICGTWIEIAAYPMPDHHFVEWNDGNQEAVRQIQVHEDFTYIAYFAANCEEYANWPITSTAHNLMPMVDVWKINELGYYFTPEDVDWYRVVGEPDDMHNNFPLDDQLVVKGSYYLALEKKLEGSYYAVVDVSDSQGMLCDGLMRSVIINYSNTHPSRTLSLLPNSVVVGQDMVLTGLNPNVKNTITVYNSIGQCLTTFTISGCDTYILKPYPMSGCYQVTVTSATVNQTLRYIVRGI